MNFEKCYGEQKDVIAAERKAEEKKRAMDEKKMMISAQVRRASTQAIQATPWFPSIPGAGVRRHIFVFLEDSSASVLSKVVSVGILFIIIASCTTFVMETMPGFVTTPAKCNINALTVDDCQPTSFQIFKDME